jgi:sortase A
MRRDTRPLALVIVIVVVLFADAAVFVARGMAPAVAEADSPLLRPAAAAAPVVTSTTMLGIAPSQPRRPVDVPANSYAPEKVVQIGTLEIPKIGLVHQVYDGITLHSIDRGPSHWPGTAYPGEIGNAVFAGHRVTHSHPFLRINELAPGDLVTFTVGGLRSVYAVTGHEVVRPKDTWIANQTATPTATLFGCHPPHSASHRYVVRMALQSVSPA